MQQGIDSLRQNPVNQANGIHGRTEMKKVYGSAKEALDGILQDGMLIAAGGSNVLAQRLGDRHAERSRPPIRIKAFCKGCAQADG